MENSILLFLLGQLVTGAAIWGAIRADIRNMMVRMGDIKVAVDHAHRRIDDIMKEHLHHREGNGR